MSYIVGRVHWLLWNLSPLFKGRYKLSFDYAFHRYTFYRTYCNGRSNRLLDCFIVVRTSKRCFRMSYMNDLYRVALYESFRTSAACAHRMEQIAEQFR